MSRRQQILKRQEADGRKWRVPMRCLVGCLLPWVLLACDSKKDDRFPPYDNTAEVEGYWKANPDFFQWKTEADLPKNLKWEDGADVPEFGDPRAVKGGTFHDYTLSYPPTFRHVGPDGNNSFRSEHWDNITISLITRHPNEDVWIPGLAEAWAVSEDRKTVFFRLQPNLTYSDGKPVEVEDFFMTFYIMRSPYLQDPWYNDWYTKEFKSITKYTDRIFAVSIPEAKPDPIWYATLPPSQREFYREYGADFPARYQWRVEPTVGAYEILLDRVKRGRSITLGRVKDWWAKDKKNYRYLFNPDFVEYKVINSPDKAFEMFRQHQLDFFLGGLPIYWYDKTEIPEVYRGYIERHVFYNQYPQVTWGVYLNESKPPLNNQDVRIGINYALDFKTVIEVDFRGDKTRMQSTSAGFGKFTNPEVRAKPYDPAKAREYFAKAGYTKAGKDGVLVNAKGKRLSFTLSTFNSGPIVPIMLRLKEAALKAGLEIIVEGLDGTQLYKKLDQKNHELAFAGFGAQPPYPRYWDFFHSTNAYKTDKDGQRKVVTDTNNITMTADPELDLLIDLHRNAKTEDEVKDLSWKLAKLIEERGNSIPAWESPFYRYLTWRWVRWPKEGNAKKSQMPLDAYMFWIDEAMKQKTLEAMSEGEDFGEKLFIHDDFKMP